MLEADQSEFDFVAKLWTISADRAKNRLPHIAPLSASTIQILEGGPVMAESGKLCPARSNPQNGSSGFSTVVQRIKDGVEQRLDRQANDWRLDHPRHTQAGTRVKALLAGNRFSLS